MPARLPPRLAPFPALAVSLCLLSLPPVLRIISAACVLGCRGWHATMTACTPVPLRGWWAGVVCLNSPTVFHGPVVVEVWGAALHLAAPPPTPLLPLLLYMPWCYMRALPLWWCCGGGSGAGTPACRCCACFVIVGSFFGSGDAGRGGGGSRLPESCSLSCVMRVCVVVCARV